MEQEEYRSGFVAVIGRPNVGKSTLVNAAIGQKIAIMSDKPQTTRNKILCVLTQPHSQILFLDTPGIHKPKHKLGEYMVQTAENTLREVDVILFMVDATAKKGPGDEYILERLRTIDTPVFLVVNKIDLIGKDEIFGVIDQYKKEKDFAAVIPISAKRQVNIQLLVDQITGRLQPGPQYYPEDMITDQPERLLMAELIREKALFMTREEIPHAIAVDVDEVSTRGNGDLYVRATLYVERESQKGIVIGAKGSLLKQIGESARKDMENLLGSKVFLDLWVKVKKDWRNRDALLKNFGYE